MNVSLKFYDDVKNVIIPLKYTDFTNSLSEMLEISNDILNCLQIFYKDEEGDKIIIQNVNDYNQFLQQLEKQEVSTIEIELGDNNLDLKEEVTKSFVKYPSNNNIPEKEIEINNENKTENIKPIMNNNSKNDNFQNNNNENKINNPYLVEPLQVVNQPKIMNAEKIIYQPKKINLHNNNIMNNNNLNNNIMNNNNLNNNIMNNNNLNNNIMNNNNLNNNIMNNNNNLNNNIMNNNNMNILNQNKQINNQNNNIQSNNSNQNQLNRNYQNIINFPVNCLTCGKFPIKNILYMCNICTLFFCEECEKVQGPIHPHPLIKIRTNQQFQKWNIIENKDESSSIIKVFGNVKNSVLGGFKSISDYFSGENNNDNKNNMNNNYNMNNQFNNNMNMNQNYFYNNPNQNQINNNYNRNYFSNNNMNQMIQIARNKYNLSNISNEQLEQAIKKANGNIDQAVISFIS